MTERLEYLLCPQGHSVPFASWNYAKDDSEGLVDADFRPMFENGLHCYGCDRAYGLSRLRAPATGEVDPHCGQYLADNIRLVVRSSDEDGLF